MRVNWLEKLDHDNDQLEPRDDLRDSLILKAGQHIGVGSLAWSTNNQTLVLASGVGEHDYMSEFPQILGKLGEFGENWYFFKTHFIPIFTQFSEKNNVSEITAKLTQFC